MVAEESSCNGSGADVLPKSQRANESTGLKTYKRRKIGKAASGGRSVDDGKGSVEGASRFVDQTLRVPDDRILRHNPSLPKIDCNKIAEGSKFCPFRHWRNIVLEQICDTLSESGGSLVGCIREAIVYHPDIDPSNDVKATVRCHGDKHRYFSQQGWMLENSHNAAEGYASVMSNGTRDEANDQTIAELFHSAFFSVIISENFGSFCKLLLETFQGINVGNLFDFTLINLRMKEGAYELSPMLFSTDIQEVWGKLEKICFDMLALAKSLSGMSKNLCHEWAQGLACGTFEDGKKKESDSQAKLERTGAAGAYKIGTCRCCGETADGKDCLVCDSCEEMYHVSCIEPAVVGVPPTSWYCVNCAAKGIGSPHENCVACERLNGPRCANNEGCEDSIGTHNERKESADCFVEDGTSHVEGREADLCCKICTGLVENGEKLMVCSHPFCYAKYYHVRCLTSKQLKSYGPQWYCPSCLCRVCLIDRDDERIVLCDGCNHAYHTYCMEPSCSSIPMGNWFCKNCAAGINRIRKARRKYAKLELKQKNDADGDELACKDREGKRLTVGMNMVSDAGKTLNCKGKLVTSR